MIRIRKHTVWHWLYKFNARWSLGYQPLETNLCHFMRCVFVWLPLKLIVPAIVIAASVVWWENALTILAVLLAVGVGAFVGGTFATVWATTDQFPNSFVWHYIKAKKQKICPLVRIEY